MSTPSQIAIEIVLALDSTLENCYRRPQDYATTVDGKPSYYPQEVRDEVHRNAYKVDDVIANMSDHIRVWTAHVRIIEELTGRLVAEGDFIYRCPECDLVSMVHDDAERTYGCAHAPVLVHLDYHSTCFEQ